MQRDQIVLSASAYSFIIQTSKNDLTSKKSSLDLFFEKKKKKKLQSPLNNHKYDDGNILFETYFKSKKNKI